MSRRQERVTRSLQQALRFLSAATRRKVRSWYKGPKTRFCDADRERLAAAVYRVMDELEHRRPTDPQVTALRATMNVLRDDTGANEAISSMPRRGPDGKLSRVPARWPDVEAAEQLMRARRRREMTDEQRAAAAERLRKARERRDRS